MYQIFNKLPLLFLQILFFIGLSLEAWSQNSKAIDSLEQLVDQAEGLNRFDPLLRLGVEYRNVDKDLSIQKLNEAREVAYFKGDSLKIVRAGRVLGEILRRFERNEEAEKILSETLPIVRRHNQQKDLKFILNSLALIYSYKAEYDKALKYNFESLLLREQDGDKLEIGLCLNNIGFVYFKLRNYPTAVDFYKRSLKIRREAHDEYELDRLLINIGLCYNQLGKFNESQKYFNEAFALCGDNCSDEIKVEGQFGLGVSNYNQQKFDSALQQFRNALTVAKTINYKRFQAENLVYIGKVFIKTGKSDLAIEALKEAEIISSSLNHNELLIDTYRQFSILYNLNKQYENASLYQSKYIALKDSVISGTLIDRLAKIQTDFAERENIQTIADKDEQIERQRNLNFAIVVIAILASLLIFVLYRGNRVKKKVNQALSEAKAIIEDQNKQLLNSNFNLDKELKEKNIELEKANASLLRVNEELDNFIYKTSHDIRGPLASLKGMCNVALMDVKDPLALSYLQKLDITAEKLNTILTRLLIVNQINNSTLGYDRIDFVGIVDDVIALEKKKGLPPRLVIKKCIDDTIDYYSDKEFIRIILENLIDNAIKFYNDSERIEPFVEISVSEGEDYVKIKVIDNGIGISEVHPDKIFQMFSRASERSETGGIGLYITKTATEKLGGHVHLKTTPEGYTEFFVTLPMATSKVLL